MSLAWEPPPNTPSRHTVTPKGKQMEYKKDKIYELRDQALIMIGFAIYERDLLAFLLFLLNERAEITLDKILDWMESRDMKMMAKTGKDIQ